MYWFSEIILVTRRLRAHHTEHVTVYVNVFYHLQSPFSSVSLNVMCICLVLNYNNFAISEEFVVSSPNLIHFEGLVHRRHTRRRIYIYGYLCKECSRLQSSKNVTVLNHDIYRMGNFKYFVFSTVSCPSNNFSM